MMEQVREKIGRHYNAMRSSGGSYSKQTICARFLVIASMPRRRHVPVNRVILRLRGKYMCVTLGPMHINRLACPPDSRQG